MKNIFRILWAPIEAFRTGRILGVEVERHPVAWIPFCLANLIALPIWILLTLTILPVFGLLQGLGLLLFSRQANRPRFTERGIEIWKGKSKIIRLVQWDEIEQARTIFDPPFVYVDLILREGESVSIFFFDEEELAVELERLGIPFHRERGESAQSHAPVGQNGNSRGRDPGGDHP